MSETSRFREGFERLLADMPDPPTLDAPTVRPVERQLSARSWMPNGLWVGATAALAVLALFVPVFFWFGSDDAGTLGESATPSHIRLDFSQELTLTCQGLETVDSGGFDSFTMDIWINTREGFTRVDITYPDGSEHDLIFKGQPGEWEAAWGRGTDLGRNAGCLETFDDGSSERSIAGWAFQDASVLWFAEFLTPVIIEDGGAVINFERDPTLATAVGTREYELKTDFTDGTFTSYDFMLDESETRVASEQRYIRVPGQFEASATFEAIESDSVATSTGIFDTTEFTPLWGRNPVVTTAITP
jgi:hypothetical protein